MIVTAYEVDASMLGTMIGGDAADALAGGAGDDLLYGGGGDVFTFDAASGSDVVLDFGIDDMLVFEGFSLADFGDPDYDSDSHETTIIGEKGEDEVEVTLRAQDGSGYSVTQEGDDVVVKITPDEGGG